MSNDEAKETPTRAEEMRIAAETGASVRLVRAVLLEGHETRHPAVTQSIRKAFASELAARHHGGVVTALAPEDDEP